MMIRRWELALLGVLALHVAGCACGSEEPYRPPFQLDNGGVKLDGVQWPDWGGPPKYDFGQTKFDHGFIPPQDGQVPKDGSVDGPPVSPDGSGNCPGPTGVNCAPACQAQELCTEASGGRCAKVYTLTGPASDKAALLPVALAYVACWAKAPSVDTLCATFDTCAMIGSLNESMVKNWVCNLAQVSDFPSPAIHTEAQSLCGCAIYQQNKADWKVPSMAIGKRGQVCLTYDSISWWPDNMDIDLCKNFPPQ